MKLFEDDFFNTTYPTFNSDKVVERESGRADVALNCAEVLIAQIQNKQISHIFLVPGKLIYPIVKALEKSLIVGIMGAHETACGFMADGYARGSRKFGVCLGISGPGTMNFLPAMAAARADRIPVLYITGGVATYHEAQGAFQDGSNGGLDEISVVKPLINSAIEIKTPCVFNHEMRRTFDQLNVQRKGCAYLNVPVNIQKNLQQDHSVKIKSIRHGFAIDASALDMLIHDYLCHDFNIAILAGSGVNNCHDATLLKGVAERFSIPVATTLSGKGAFPEKHPLALGLYGFAGHTRAIKTINDPAVDVLIVLGSDLTQRDSLNWCPELHSNKTLIFIDDDFEKNCLHYQPDIEIFSSLSKTLDYLLNSRIARNTLLLAAKQKRSRWISDVHKLSLMVSKTSLFTKQDEEDKHLFAGDVVHYLRNIMPEDTNVVVDSGAHRIFMAHYWSATGIGDYHTSSELAPMGWAICAGIGIKLAQPERPCMVVTGDGCMLMHGIEIQTAARYGIKMLFVVINNQAHGAMHIDTLHQRGISADFTRLPTHDWVGFATSLGVTATRVKHLAELRTAVDSANEHPGPFLIEVIVGNHSTPNRYYSQSVTAYEARIAAQAVSALPQE